VIVTETATATGKGTVIEIAGAATRETIGETTEEMTDVTTEEMIGAMTDVETIGSVHTPATDETANLLRLPEILPKRQSRPLQSKMKSSRQRGRNSKHGKKREKPRKLWMRPRPKLWHSWKVRCAFNHVETSRHFESFRFRGFGSQGPTR